MTINFGARGHDITTATDFDSLAAGLAAQGARCTQLALGKSFPHMPSGAAAINPGMGEYCRAALAARGVSVAVLGCYVNPMDRSGAEREAAVARFESYLRHARYFGAPVVGTHPGRLGAGEADSPESWRSFADLMRRLADVGERFGAIVGLEPCPHHALHDLESVERLLDAVDSPFLGVILDPAGHAVGDAAGDGADDPADPAEREVAVTREAFRRFGERIVAFHLKDFTVVPGTTGATVTAAEIAPCQIGDGVAPVARLLEIVDRARPYLPVIIEGTRNDRIGATIRRYGGDSRG
ncbi:AP endonuclease [Bifidobacterium sp. DSM 109958]|uniref:AP endonuclease n=1 Tax=Bifidobacterium moraviense TaxID=2675323 RepID=A0A7Y0I073_9BIFI|nr:sugar phosphate isomerase/epimerase family protein [Bifidobacterium sp. DSM 109958]NMN01000.1 AP endonuclease [Bifidobacterium sp. DSM 109958]